MTGWQSVLFKSFSWMNLCSTVVQLWKVDHFWGGWGFTIVPSLLHCITLRICGVPESYKPLCNTWTEWSMQIGCFLYVVTGFWIPTGTDGIKSPLLQIIRLFIFCILCVDSVELCFTLEHRWKRDPLKKRRKLEGADTYSNHWLLSVINGFFYVKAHSIYVF